MSSKNWKSLLFAFTLAASLTACGQKEDTAPAASPYTGVWANQYALTKWRENKGNLNAFCQYVYAWAGKKKVQGRYIDLKLHPYIVQTNNEVFLYSSYMSMNQAGYREVYYQGVLDKDGILLMSNGSTSFQAFETRRTDVIADRSRFSVDQNRTLLTVNQSRKNLHFVRTEPGEMAAYITDRTTCEENWTNQEKPTDQGRTEDGADNHNDEDQSGIPQESEFGQGS
jgi:hypothetical protein